MTNSSASKFTVSPGPYSPSPASCNDGNGRWIEAEEVKPPAVRPITFEAIEEGTMAVVQQALAEVLAIAAEGDLQNLAVEVE